MKDLVSDLHEVIQGARKAHPTLEGKVLFVGHSLGAVIACKYLATHREPHLGLVMLEFVEGPALPAIPHAVAQLRATPRTFPSLDAAREWALSSGRLQSASSANLNLSHTLRFSPPGSTGELRWVAEAFMGLVDEGTLEEWFKGTSAAFAALTLPRLLMVASVHSLSDRDLTVQQMQGKIGVVVLSGGHALHEDLPREVAREVAVFTERALSKA